LQLALMVEMLIVVAIDWKQREHFVKEKSIE